MGIMKLNTAMQVPFQPALRMAWRNALSTFFVVLSLTTSAFAQESATVVVDRNPVDALPCHVMFVHDLS